MLPNATFFKFRMSADLVLEAAWEIFRRKPQHFTTDQKISNPSRTVSRSYTHRKHGVRRGETIWWYGKSKTQNLVPVTRKRHIYQRLSLRAALLIIFRATIPASSRLAVLLRVGPSTKSLMEIYYLRESSQIQRLRQAITIPAFPNLSSRDVWRPIEG